MWVEFVVLLVAVGDLHCGLRSVSHYIVRISYVLCVSSCVILGYVWVVLGLLDVVWVLYAVGLCA